MILRPIIVACLLAFAANTASAQGVPIPVRNADEPGRNPFQEAQLTSCTDPGDCQVVFASVPANTRRVVEYVNCEVDLGEYGALIGVNLGYQPQKLARAALPFTTMSTLPSRSLVNSVTRLYYEANDKPSVDVYTQRNGTTFLLCTISGYNVTFP